MTACSQPCTITQLAKKIVESMKLSELVIVCVTHAYRIEVSDFSNIQKKTDFN